MTSMLTPIHYPFKGDNVVLYERPTASYYANIGTIDAFSVPGDFLRVTIWLKEYEGQVGYVRSFHCHTYVAPQMLCNALREPFLHHWYNNKAGVYCNWDRLFSFLRVERESTDLGLFITYDDKDFDPHTYSNQILACQHLDMQKRNELLRIKRAAQYASGTHYTTWK